MIHLLNNSLTRTHCGLAALDLPREQVTSISSRTDCQECKKAAIEQMYRNYEENTAPPLRGPRPEDE